MNNHPYKPEHYKEIRAYLARHPQARAIDIAAALEYTEAEALDALSDTAWYIPAQKLAEVLDEIRTWERVMVLVRNGDAVAEIETAGDGWYTGGDWLNWIEEGYNLHIRIRATDHVLGLVRDGKYGLTHSFNLVNEAGQVFCRFYARTPTTIDRFLQFCRGSNCSPPPSREPEQRSDQNHNPCSK